MHINLHVISTGRTLSLLDNRTIHSALQSGIQTVGFDRLTKIIIELQEKETIIEYVNEISNYFIVVY